MLACALASAPSTRWSSVASPRRRVRHAHRRRQAEVMVTSDAGMRGGKAVPYKHLLDRACRLSQFPGQVVIVNRGLDKGMAARRRA